MANSVDSDQMLQNVVSDQGCLFAKAYLSQYLGLFWKMRQSDLSLHCLLIHVWPNTYGLYSNAIYEMFFSLLLLYTFRPQCLHEYIEFCIRI